MRQTFLAALGCLLALGTAAGAETAVRYRLDVTYGWSAATHPDRFPDGAHMTSLLGVAHDARYVMFQDGATGSSGLALMAEGGRDTILAAEWTEAMRGRRVGTVIMGPDVDVVPGALSVEFETTQDHPLMSFTSMIAPSPDWFTGVAGLSLREGEVWRDRVAVTLWAWDAGSDSGMDYIAPNAPTQPRESVRLLAVPQFLGADGLRAVGKAVLTRVK